jgi:murein DD-endopeptidase MepM/ murein hydrolase activator NlpD
MDNEMTNPVLADFPLEGEWFAPNTPAVRIPSHGTDALGQRYAYDFMMADWSGRRKMPFCGQSWRYYLLGIPLSQWYGWGRNIYAPCNGKIITVKDGLKERQRVHLLTDLFVVFKNALFFDPQKHDLQNICGNYIILQTENAYALLAHFQKGSIRVTEGQEVKTGELLGQVGHSGNSTAPHLHFQLMDSPDLFAARGIPCAFKRYERFQNGEWEEVPEGIPSDQDRIRRRI